MCNCSSIGCCIFAYPARPCLGEIEYYACFFLTFMPSAHLMCPDLDRRFTNVMMRIWLCRDPSLVTCHSLWRATKTNLKLTRFYTTTTSNNNYVTRMQEISFLRSPSVYGRIRNWTHHYQLYTALQMHPFHIAYEGARIVSIYNITLVQDSVGTAINTTWAANGSRHINLIQKRGDCSCDKNRKFFDND